MSILHKTQENAQKKNKTLSERQGEKLLKDAAWLDADGGGKELSIEGSFEQRVEKAIAIQDFLVKAGVVEASDLPIPSMNPQPDMKVYISADASQVLLNQETYDTLQSKLAEKESSRSR